MEVADAVPPQIGVVNPATLRRRQEGDEPEDRAEGEKVQAPPKFVSEEDVSTAGPSERDDRPERRVAVLVCHGMGQQVPFENLDMIATALAKQDGAQAAPDHPRDSQPKEREDRVGFVRIGEQWLPRAELELTPQGGKRTKVHVYEAYWAPLTEGKVSAFDVTRFLFDAGARGIKHALKGSFDRWMFGGRKTLPISRWALGSLSLAFAVILSLLTLYGALGFVAVARLVAAGFSGAAVDGFMAGLQATLLRDLFRSPLALALAVPPILLLGWMVRMARALVSQRTLVVLGIILLGAELLTTTLGDLLHRSIWMLVSVQPLGALPEAGAAGDWYYRGFLAAAAVLGAAFWLQGRSRMLRDTLGRFVVLSAAVVAAWSIAYAGIIAWHALQWVGSPSPAPVDPAIPLGRGFIVYFLLAAILACYRLRAFYIQYLGDVAVYLSSHQLNEFDEIRAKIKKVGYEVGCAIYEAERPGPGHKPEYDEIVVAGHSLGSVVAYDTLNAVLNEDRVRKGTLKAEKRTRMLLTFGSPLDKSAFVFRTQIESADYREALAAAVQPLIEPGTVEEGKSPSRGRTIPWVNIYSPFDPVSGPVDFYDPPKAETPEGHLPVDNDVDHQAFIFGQAHVTYWKNPTLRKLLYEAVTTPRQEAPAGSPPVEAAVPGHG